MSLHSNDANNLKRKQKFFRTFSLCLLVCRLRVYKSFFSLDITCHNTTSSSLVVYRNRRPHLKLDEILKLFSYFTYGVVCCVSARSLRSSVVIQSCFNFLETNANNSTSTTHTCHCSNLPLQIYIDLFILQIYQLSIWVKGWSPF